jgi:hypothetical protein
VFIVTSGSGESRIARSESASVPNIILRERAATAEQCRLLSGVNFSDTWRRFARLT